MPIENEPLKTSIQQRLEKERLELFEKKRFNIQLFIIVSIILGLILTVIQIYLKLFG